MCVHISMCAHTPKQMINHASGLLQAKWIKGQREKLRSPSLSVCLSHSRFNRLQLASRHYYEPKAKQISNKKPYQ